MTEEEYRAAIEQYKAEHSAGGSLEHGEWKKHKYIRIENGRYIYPDDLKKNASDKKASVQGKIDEFESSDQKYVKLGKAGGTSVVTGKPMTQEEIDSKRYGSANLAEARKVNDARHDKTLSGEIKKGEGTVPDELYERNKVNLEGATRTIHELKKENARLDKVLKNLEELEKHQEAAEKYQDAKDREAKKEQQARQDEAKKITSMTPDEARKRAAELAGKAQAETPKKESGVGVTVAEKKEGILGKPKQEESSKPVGGNRDMSVDAQEKAKKEAERKKTGYSESNEALAKKYNLSDDQIESALKSAAHKKYLLDHDLSLDAHKRAAELDGFVQETSSGWFIADRKKNLVAFYETVPLEDFVKSEIESLADSKKIQHSYTDPKSFYAAVYDYKQAHKR